MIQFRCWFCNKSYALPKRRVGERMICTCKRRLRVPSRSGGNSHARTVVDWLVEALVYGGGGAFLGFGLGLLVLSRWRVLEPVELGWAVVGALTLTGFLAGLAGGERGVNWIGRMIRDRENS